jgi:opacity protein-like surface antigen
MNKRFLVVAVALACAAASATAAAFAQAGEAAAPARAARRNSAIRTCRRPRASRPPARRPPAPLHAQVVRKLARQFGAADTQNNGSITEAQARAAGLGYVANHFRQIDSSGGGRVSFADVQRMQARSTSQQ